MIRAIFGYLFVALAVSFVGAAIWYRFKSPLLTETQLIIDLWWVVLCVYVFGMAAKSLLVSKCKNSKN